MRSYVGDIDAERQLLQDEEIAALVADTSSPLLAAAEAAEAISARFAILPSRTIGSTRVDYSQQATMFAGLAKNLRRRADRRSMGIPYAGGIEWDEYKTNRADRSVVPPHIRINQHAPEWKDIGFWGSAWGRES